MIAGERLGRKFGSILMQVSWVEMAWAPAALALSGAGRPAYRERVRDRG